MAFIAHIRSYLRLRQELSLGLAVAMFKFGSVKSADKKAVAFEPGLDGRTKIGIDSRKAREIDIDIDIDIDFFM